MLNSANHYPLLAERARRLLDELEVALRQGNLTTEQELLGALLLQTDRLETSLREPSMQVEPLGRDSLLVYERVIGPLLAAREDCEVSHIQIERVRQLTRQIFNLCQAERAGLSRQLQAVYTQLSAYHLWASDSDTSFLWAGDSFNDRSRVSTETTAWIDTQAGVCTLFPEESRSLSERIVAARIDTELSSPGLPGNLLEIQSPGTEAYTGADAAPQPRRYSDVLQTDRLPVLWDENPATWFEWERLFVPIPQPVLRAGRAYVADPAGQHRLEIPRLQNWNCFVRWPGATTLDTGPEQNGYAMVTFEGANVRTPRFNPRATKRRRAPGQPPFSKGPGNPRPPLTLALALELDRAQAVDWLEIRPLILHGTYPTLQQVLVSANGETWRELLDEPMTLHPRMNRGVKYEQLATHASNFEGIGVVPLPDTPIRYLKLIFQQEHSYRTPHGIAHPFWFQRGGGSGKKEGHRGRVWGPISIRGDYASVASDGEGALAPVAHPSNPVRSKRELHAGLDVFQADRQVIALRDLSLQQRLYTERSQLVAVPFSLERAVRSVALLVDERVPDDWPATTPEGQRWIEYEVSPDGSEWFAIIPQDSELGDSVVSFDTPTTQLHFRALFQRPDDRPHTTPVLGSYALKLLPDHSPGASTVFESLAPNSGESATGASE